MKDKINRNKQRESITGTGHTGDRKEEENRKNGTQHEERSNVERHLNNRVAKRAHHPDGPGGSYDGL